MYQVETTPEFDSDIFKLDKSIATRIIKKIEWLSEHPELLKFPLKHLPDNLKGLQKYRIGDYRILFWINHNKKVITLYGIEHRRKVYDNL